MTLLSRQAYHDLRLACRAELTARNITVRAAADAIDADEKHLSGALAPSSFRRPGMLIRLAAWLGIERIAA